MEAAHQQQEHDEEVAVKKKAAEAGVTATSMQLWNITQCYGEGDPK